MPEVFCERDGPPGGPAYLDESVAWIGLGGNLGDVAATLGHARTALARLACGPLRESRLFSTAPWGPTPGPEFLNQVVGFPCRLPAETLLSALLELEASLGRVRLERWGPRTLDLDLLTYGALICTTPTLTLPHPRLAERRFVLLPWAEVSPDLTVPGLGRTVAALLADCPDSGRVWPSPG